MAFRYCGLNRLRHSAAFLIRAHPSLGEFMITSPSQDPNQNLFILSFCLFIFRERGREGEREEEEHRCVRDTRIGCMPPAGVQACALTGNGICDPSVRTQASAQSTEPHQPRPKSYLQSPFPPAN